MKECPKCKTMMEDDALFCGECGTKFEVEEVADQVEETAAPQEKKCIHCGETIEEDSAFCPYCGKPQTVENVDESLQDKQAEEPEPEKESVPEKKVEAEKEEPKSDEKPEPKNSVTQEIPEEQISYEVEEEKKSKKWLWVLLVVLLAGAGAWYFFSQNGYSLDDGETMTEAVDSDTIAIVPEEDEIAPTSARGFLEEFYKGEYGDEGFIKQNVTANVLDKLKRDYDYDCPSNDCLVTWVFTAYPAGADMDMEEGPIISETDIEGRFKVDFKYSFYNGEQKGFDNRTVYLTVSNMDGRYLISDYELVVPDMEQSQEDMPNIDGDADAKMAKIPDGDYFLSDGRFKMKLQKRNSKVNGEFYFFDGSDRSADYLFSGNLDENNMINANVRYAEKSDRNEGTIKGVFNGEEFNVRVCLNYGRHNGNYKLKEQ